MALQRYDVESAEPGVGRSGTGARSTPPSRPRTARWCCSCTGWRRSPSSFAHAGGRAADRARVLEAELYTRARELQEVNERLRQAHAREREVALALQDGDAARPAPGRPPPGRRALPARRRRAERVRRLVRPGRPAGRADGGRRRRRRRPRAGGRLRHGPAAQRAQRRLPRLGRPGPGPGGARPVRPVRRRRRVDHRGDGPSSTGTPAPSPTAAPAILRPPCCAATARWSSWTRPPTRRSAPAPNTMPRPEARHRLHRGRTLVLYTDGLIERRREDIDVGLARLAALPGPPPHAATPRRWPTRSWPTCSRPAAPPTTPPCRPPPVGSRILSGLVKEYETG